jgi:hypothetical protein
MKFHADLFRREHRRARLLGFSLDRGHRVITATIYHIQSLRMENVMRLKFATISAPTTRELKPRELTADELDVVAGGGKAAVVQAGWNLAQNKKVA